MKKHTGVQVPVKSSNLKSVGYDEASGMMSVQFREGGGIYRYHAVPPNVHAELMAAKSKGKFFRAAIRNRYRASVDPKDHR